MKTEQIVLVFSASIVALAPEGKIDTQRFLWCLFCVYMFEVRGIAATDNSNEARSNTAASK